ncbi:MAG: hypothetical protein GAK28_02310 [Luteibacter sp.]|uniref:DUF802 domain-containing protein n=1 Tax=Luteibacter sp. TaxID=1886636 RepID=UPI00137EFFA1|nr:DUF802 domain-containing protein [Luteibacter sp.]KAF1006636.1 MAG: hypothetical protein GAK28_02310 [Luteibacter sp.]
MFRNLLYPVVFLAGLAVVCWIGVGYVGSNPLGAAVAALVGACYLAGALELYRYRQATVALRRSVADLSSSPTSLDTWLGGLPQGLRNAVRLRVEGERVALPAPTLTPYLVGLLVLLGMLGTLLGMMATLRGTGLALESATDLQAMRGSLAAPVKGLGFAFGTSIAGVATSAMLGLLSALCRRERVDVVQALDTKVATTLRVHSQAYRREESLRLAREQAEAMPALVDRLQAMMTSIEQHNAAATERQLASQQAFHTTAEAIYTRLAVSVEQSLKEGIADSARAASASIQPAVEATMAGLASESNALRDTVTQAVQRQLDGLSSGFEASSKAMSSVWSEALAQQRQANETLVADLRGSLAQFSETFEQRSAGLVEHVASRVDAAAGSAAQAWTDALAKQEAANDALATRHAQALSGATTSLGEQAASLVDAVTRSHADMQSVLESRDAQRLTTWKDTLGEVASTLHTQWREVGEQAAKRQQDTCEAFERTANAIATTSQARADDTIAEVARTAKASSEAVATVASTLRTQIEEAGERAAARDESIRESFESSAKAIMEGQQERTEQTIAEVARLAQSSSEAFGSVASTLRAQWDEASERASARDASIRESFESSAKAVMDGQQERTEQTIAEVARLAQSSSEAFGTVASTLHAQWEQVGEQSTQRQQAICDTLERTADAITASAKVHANDTIAEISRLVEAAAEAPKVAAEVVGELRQKLSDSMVRDTAMLEERTRLLATLETLLDAVNHASVEQRTAIDALVGSSAELLERVGTRFTDHIEAETGKLETVAAQVTGSAAEVASLGEAFGAAVQSYGASNDQLMERLQQIAETLDQSSVRSDEQLAYYVAQAREVVDLSVLSQKQILDEMQRLASQREVAGNDAA